MASILVNAAIMVDTRFARVILRVLGVFGVLGGSSTSARSVLPKPSREAYRRGGLEWESTPVLRRGGRGSRRLSSGRWLHPARAAKIESRTSRSCFRRGAR